MSPFKDRLITALHTAVQSFNESNDPNEAVVKAAQEHDFNLDQTRRLVETFNTARTLYHYKSAQDRTANFALADADEVLPRLFDVKAPEKKAQAADYSCYQAPERDWRHNQNLEKAASWTPSLSEPAPTADGVSTQAMKALRGYRQTIKIAQDEARIAASSAAFCLTKLANLFARGSNKGLLEDQYARLIVAYGKDPEHGPVVSKIASFVPQKDQAPASLVTRYNRDAVIDDRDLGQHLELLKEAKNYLEVEAELLAGAGVLQKEADSFEHDFMQEIAPFFQEQARDLSSFIRPEILKAAQQAPKSPKPMTHNLYGEPVEIAKDDDGPKNPGLHDAIADTVGGAMGKSMAGYIDTGVERAFTEPQARENKALSERLKNVQSQIMLQDLLTNDPVLADEPPEKTVEAYNAILQMAPEVAANKEVVRAILRQTVHSTAISPYEADIWTKLEGNLRNIRGKGNPMPQGAKR